MFFVYLMCTLAENSSNQANRTVDISINPRDVTADWPRKGLRCTKPAISKMKLQSKPADPNKCRLQLTKGERLGVQEEPSAGSRWPIKLWPGTMDQPRAKEECSVTASQLSRLTDQPRTVRPVRLGAQCNEGRTWIWQELDPGPWKSGKSELKEFVGTNSCVSCCHQSCQKSSLDPISTFKLLTKKIQPSKI